LVIGFFGPAEIPSIGILHRGTEAVVWPEGVEWIRVGLFLSIVILTSGIVLFIQYRARQTNLSRLLGLVLLVFGILSSVSIPPTLATELHARFSVLPSFASQVRIEVGAMPRKFAAARRDRVQLSIPLDVNGIPADVDAHLDAASITLEAADGQKAAAFTIPGKNVSSSGLAFDDMLFVDPTFFFASQRKQPIKLRGTVYITVFGNRRSTNVTFTHGPQNVGDGLRCYVNEMSGQLHCLSALRWPRLLVDAKVRDETEHFWPLISYSPFPSGMELNYVEEHRVGGPPPRNPQATILTMEPLAHFRTDFSVDDFQMERFALGR